MKNNNIFSGPTVYLKVMYCASQEAPMGRIPEMTNINNPNQNAYACNNLDRGNNLRSSYKMKTSNQIKISINVLVSP